jgi:hypothetical protein
MNQDSPVALCCVPKRPPAPEMTRSVIGTDSRPPLMKRYLGSWLTMASPAVGMKSANMNSTMGRMPMTAMPRATPVKPFSQMGVLMTRPPCLSARPALVLKTPPSLATSSPMKTTAASSASASSMAALTASR